MSSSVATLPSKTSNCPFRGAEDMEGSQQLQLTASRLPLGVDNSEPLRKSMLRCNRSQISEISVRHPPCTQAGRKGNMSYQQSSVFEHIRAYLAVFTLKGANIIPKIRFHFGCKRSSTLKSHSNLESSKSICEDYTPRSQIQDIVKKVAMSGGGGYNGHRGIRAWRRQRQFGAIP